MLRLINGKVRVYSWRLLDNNRVQRVEQAKGTLDILSACCRGSH